MAGTYTKKEFGVGPEEQTLLKDSNGTRIVPSKGNGAVGMPSVTSTVMATGECNGFLGMAFLWFYFPTVQLPKPVCGGSFQAVDLASLALKYLWV